MSGFLDNWIVHVAAFLQPKLSGSRFHSPLTHSRPLARPSAGLRLWRIPFVASQATQVSFLFRSSYSTRVK
jgi:hypothetical protein